MPALKEIKIFNPHYKDFNTYKTSPIKVKVMLFYDKHDHIGHIGIKAWVPGTGHRYCIHFVDYRSSTDDWGCRPDRDNADNDIEICERSFIFDTDRTLEELKDWHKTSKFYNEIDWKIYNNCADAIHALMTEFFELKVNQVSSCVKTPISTCLWSSTRISLPRSVYAAVESAVKNSDHRIASTITCKP